ncbi:Zinc finger MYM-type protein 1 [Linum grandiflorum]
MHQSEHIDKILQKQTSEEVQKNIVRVNASISAARWLTLQGLPFRGNDEGTSSGNRGNFIELLKHTASYNKEVAGVILENAPKNAKYTSPDIQKEIVHVIGGMVRKQIFEEIGDSKFSIIVDEASDESRKEQMPIVLRFVDIKGLIQERLFDVVHVKNTTSMTLYSSICSTLSSHKFAIQNIRGQGYDGTSNMRGEWNGLKALFLNEYPQAYYVHCMAHRLQLALVAAANVFNTIIDYQIEEIRSRFDEKVVELLKLSSCLDPSDGYKAIDIDAICTLAKKYYPLDFSEQEIEILEFQLRLYQVDVPNHPSLKKLSSVAELCYSLTETGKSSQFYLVDRLIRLILTLPVSTATGERVFSAMKIVQTRLRSKMHDEFLADSLVIYVERDISKTFSLDAILSNFSDVKERRVQLK